MLITWKQLCGAWILSRDGEPLGRVRDVVVDPNTGEIPALWVKSVEGIQLLSVTEIQRWSREEIWVESLSDLISAEEFPRLQQVLQNEIRIIGVSVFEQREKPQLIGKCKDLSFDTLSPKLLSLEVESGILFWKNVRVIHRKQILEIKESGIFISAPVISDSVEDSSSVDILGNALPEPEVSQTFRG
jgi:uncharacterized protein YrrD